MTSLSRSVLLSSCSSTQSDDGSDSTRTFPITGESTIISPPRGTLETPATDSTPAAEDESLRETRPYPVCDG